ncbi:hypothetical protein [Streptomyces sp. NPDC005438]|uniref:hypothetical protein n=1 Tax=Streptomyces sp. NPDC005438 TaxID=3156880 RepID=UPI0033A5746E
MEPTPETDNRRGKVTIIAVATAAVLAVGGGGAFLASSSGSDAESTANSGDSKPSPLRLDGYGQKAESTKKDKGIAPGEPYSTTYKAKGELPSGPDSAPIYQTKPTEKSKVSELAKALEVVGSPRQEDGTWKVGTSRDMKAGTLTVDAGKSLGRWNYSRSTTPGENKGKPVSEEKAKDAIADALKALGLEDAEVKTQSTYGSQRLLAVEPEVGDLPTHNWRSTFTLDDKGELIRAQGRLPQLDKGADYPLLTAKQALAALNKHRGQNGGIGIMCGQGGSEGKAGSTGKAGESGKAAPCGPARDGKQAAEVEKATFGLASHYSDGKPLLVPSWIYEVKLPGAKDNYPVSYPALKPEFIIQQKNDEVSGGGRTLSPQSVEPYKADDKKLKLHFWGGVCDNYEAVTKESKDEVRINVKSTPKKGQTKCIKIAKRLSVDVELDKAVGERKIVDGNAGKPLPQKKELPQKR